MATSVIGMLKHGSFRPECSPGHKDGKTFSDLLNARKTQLNPSLVTASIITWALADHA